MTGPEPPSWMGGPAFVPDADNLAPHAPMPGAPPYPPAVHPPPAAVGRTGYPTALGAAAVWAVVNLVLVLVLAGPPPTPTDLARFVGALVLATALAALPVWAIARRRTMPLIGVVVLALPAFVVVRLIMNLPGA